MNHNFKRDETERLAYRLWQERGSPIGSPEEDWFQAEKELRDVQLAQPDPPFSLSLEATEN